MVESEDLPSTSSLCFGIFLCELLQSIICCVLPFADSLVLKTVLKVLCRVCLMLLCLRDLECKMSFIIGISLFLYDSTHKCEYSVVLKARSNILEILAA